MANTDFQFITSINTISRNAETRRKVRSHARRQKLPNDPASSGSGAAAKQSTQKERVSKFRIGAASVAPGAPAEAGAVAETNVGPGAATGAVMKPRRPATTKKSPKTTSHTSTVTTITHLGEDGAESKDVALVGNPRTMAVARELPTFSLLKIETTPLTESLLKYVMTVCLSPQEKSLKKWFDRAGAPTYMYTRKTEPYPATYLVAVESSNLGSHTCVEACTDPNRSL
jgi:hypothetical protein